MAPIRRLGSRRRPLSLEISRALTDIPTGMPLWSCPHCGLPLGKVTPGRLIHGRWLSGQPQFFLGRPRSLHR